MTVWGLFLLAALVMRLWPETRFARGLHHYLIERPLDLIGRFRRRHVIFLVVGFALLYSFAQIGMPHLAMAAAIDVSAYVDAMITVTTIAALNRSRTAWTAVFARLPRPRRAGPRPRRRRQGAAAVRRPSANDDDGHGVFAFAA